MGEMSAAQLAVLKKSLLGIGLIFNLGLIFYFKYYDFFVDNLNKVFSTDFQLKNIVLPLGISFFTFQQVSYMVDSYRGETKEYNFADYALFVTFFPQLIAGPIVLHNEVLPQFEDKNNWKINWDNMARGLYMFAAGLVKKAVIADTLSGSVSWGYGHLSSGSYFHGCDPDNACIHLSRFILTSADTVIWQRVWDICLISISQ